MERCVCHPQPRIFCVLERNSSFGALAAEKQEQPAWTYIQSSHQRRQDGAEALQCNSSRPSMPSSGAHCWAQKFKFGKSRKVVANGTLQRLLLAFTRIASTYQHRPAGCGMVGA